MAGKVQWNWGKEHSKAAQKYLADLESGKVKPILLTHDNIQDVLGRD